MTRFSTYLLCLSAALLPVGHAAADGVMRDGMGAISGGRGGTNLGHFDNGAVIHDNPAGMMNVRGRGLDEISVDGLLAHLDYSDEHNGGATADRVPYVLPYLSVMRKSDDELWAYGLGIFAPAGFGAKYEMTNPNIGIGGPEYTYKSFGALAKILPAVSARLTDRLSVGGTLGLAISHTELEAPFYVQNGPPNPPTLMDIQGTGAATCWSAGLQYELTEATMLGVTYTSESRFDLEGSAAIDIAGLGHSRYDLDMGLIWPQSVGVGLRHEINPRRVFSADVIWYDWSRAFDTLEMTMSNPSNPVFEGALGPVVTDTLALNWRDTISVRLGYEHAIGERSVLRTGYIYHRNPIPDSTLTPLIPATLEHAISTGFGHQWCDSRFDIGYQISFGSDRSVGTSAIVGGDFDDSEMESSAHWLFVSYQKQF